MGLELVAVVLFARLLEASQFLRENAALLVFTSVFLILWFTGIITVVRRWEGR